MNLHLEDIQPSSDWLSKERVKKLLKNPTSKRLFRDEKPIIYRCYGYPFKFYSRIGDEQLYVCHILKIEILPLKSEWPDDEELYLPSAMNSYNKGIRSWEDFTNKIIPERNIDIFYSEILVKKEFYVVK